MSKSNIIRFSIPLIVGMGACLFSCTGSKDAHQVYRGGMRHIVIEDPGSIEEIRLSDFVKQVNVIPLESGPEALIGEIERMHINKDTIYIKDKYRNDALLVFDFSGSFLGTVGSLGKGDKEYLELSDFDVSGENIYIYDRRTQRIFIYDLKGNLTEIRKISGFKGSNFAARNDLFYLYQDSYNTASDYQLNIFNAEGDLRAQYFPTDKANKHTPQTAVLSGAAANGSISFYTTLNDTIYRLERDSLYAAYFVDFKSHKVSEEDMPILLSEPDKMDDITRKKKYAVNVRNVLIGSRYLYFDYYYLGVRRPVFFDMEQGRVRNSYNILDDISFTYFSSPIAMYNGQFVSALYPESFENNIDMIERMDDMGVQVTELGKQNLTMLKAASKDIFNENAILIVYEFE